MVRVTSRFAVTIVAAVSLPFGGDGHFPVFTVYVMITPLGSAGGSQERVRVVAVEVAVGTVRIPGAIYKERIYYTRINT